MATDFSQFPFRISLFKIFSSSLVSIHSTKYPSGIALGVFFFSIIFTLFLIKKHHTDGMA